MSILREAHDVVINKPEFNQIIVNVNSQSGIDILLDASTPEAAVDAVGRGYPPSCYPPSCYPDTRTQYIEDITNWAAASNGDHPPIYWMRGPAGVGKSAIAQTCAQNLKDSGRLGAAFFFSVNGRRNDHTRFFPTLAYQLSTILDDYCQNVARRVLRDKTIIRKTLKAQFEGLIVEPLRELKEQGKEVQMRPIFIDGLDECENKDAQVEIIKLIAASVQDQSTPFRWAIFSRAELHIASTFELSHISPHCRLVHLPISRDSDKEIEIYLRGGFENILRRRMVSSLSWPTDEDMKKLVDAAAGLFGYCATVLRFIDTYSFSGFKETLQAVLDVIAQPGIHPISPFSELDRLYTLILQRVPEDLLSSMLLFLYWATAYDTEGTRLGVAVYCNVLGLSETVFESICNHLQAVMAYHGPLQSLQMVDCVDLTRPSWSQDSSFAPGLSSISWPKEVYGTLNYLHKSFRDFLLDSERSSIFCVVNETLHGRFFGSLVQRHFHISSSYSIQGSGLVLAPGVTSSSTTLSWPHGTEFVDSYLKLCVYVFISLFFDARLLLLTSFAKSISPVLVQGLTEWDHRKSSIAVRMFYGLGLRRGFTVLGCQGSTQQVEGTLFNFIGREGCSYPSPANTLAGIETFRKLGVVKDFHPYLPSALAFVRNLYSRSKPGKYRGLYELGRGEKSVIWYWEFDDEKQYYHEFRTMNYTEAMRIYKTEKFKMWEEEWVPPPRVLES